MSNKEIQNLIMVEIIAPSNDFEHPSSATLTEECRNEIYTRFKAKESWERVFEPIEDKDIRIKYVELFNKLDEDEIRTGQS